MGRGTKAGCRTARRLNATSDGGAEEDLHDRYRNPAVHSLRWRSRPAGAARPLAKEAFVVAVADRAVVLVRQNRLAGVYVAAPPALMSLLRERLAASVRVSGVIGKDLTKVPDHELGPWLDEARYAPSGN